MHPIYGSKTYRDFLAKELDSEHFGRGARAELAEYLGVQNSFISQVLSGKQNFTLEQTIRLAQFLSLKDPERDFLLLLVSKERSGSQELKEYYQHQIKRRLESKNEVQNRVSREVRKIGEQELTEYYGSWHTPAIHMLLKNSKIRDLNEISRLLSLEPRLVRESMDDSKSAEKIRAAVLKTIEECDPIIRDAGDEEVHTLLFDFYKIA